MTALFLPDDYQCIRETNREHCSDEEQSFDSDEGEGEHAQDAEWLRNLSVSLTQHLPKARYKQTCLTIPKKEAFKMRSSSPVVCEMHSGWMDLRWLHHG